MRRTPLTSPFTSMVSGLLLSTALTLAAPALAQQAAPVQPAPAPATSAAGIDPAMMDTSVKPGDDFFLYANGRWFRDAVIPADRATLGGLVTASIETERRNAELIQRILAERAAATTDHGRIANFYTAYRDTAAIDALGLAPVRGALDQIAAIRTRTELSRALGASVRADVDPLNATNFRTENLFGVFVTQGLATPGEVMPYLLQGGLGLPEREYYRSADPKMAAIRAAYRPYVARILTLAGMTDAEARADRIIALEAKIAEAHATRADSEDFTRGAEVWSRADFAAKAPGIDWDAFFTAAQLGAQQRFGAYHAGAIPRIAALVASEPVETWKDWLAFHHLSTHADVLPKAFDDARFAFYGTTLAGTTQPRPRDVRALTAINTYLGDAMGRAYADAYFPASAKTEVQAMAEAIKAAFARRVEALDWMAPSTKAEALAKVRGIVVGVGYPDNWRDYSTLTVAPNAAYANTIAAERFEYAHQLAKLGKPMDRAEWWMAPQTVNAVNLPVQNALNFPAGILQHPLFDPASDPAANYGAIGAVIGHEVSHSFDNNGAAFDATGRLRNWWTDADRARFDEQGAALARQFDAYAPFPDLHVNGTLTLGENIADVAGLSAAYDAYRASLNGREAPVIGGFTGDQRFFIAYAQVWASKMREQAMRARIATDGHAPGQYRTMTVRNIDAWYDAFGVKPGDAMYLAPEQRVRIW